MEGVAFFLALILLIVCSCIFIAWNVFLGRRKKQYQMLASRYGGNVVSRFLFRPKMWFRYGTSMGYLKSKRKRGFKEQTILILTWPDKKLRFDVSTLDSPLRPSRYTKVLDAKELGFSLDFFVQSNKPDEIKKMFCDGVRWKIEQLVGQLGSNSLTVFLSAGKLKIIKPGEVRNFQQLDDLVRMGLELHDQLLLTKSEGIDFVDGAEAKILGDVKCPICSEDVIEEMVICLRCKTPHCKDCWQYNGHCATFACNETRYYQAGSAAVR